MPKHATEDYVNVSQSYSATETDTGTKWIDGKTIYRKTIDCGALPNASSKAVAHGITGVTQVIALRGFAHRPAAQGAEQWYMFPALSYSATVMVTAHVTPTQINVSSVDNRSTFTETYITLEYTK